MTARVRLGWLNLAHHKGRLAVSVAGVAAAVLLMLLELGFLNALFDSQVEVIRKLSADLVIVNVLKYSMAANVPFPRRRLAQAMAVDGVAAADPVYVEYEASVWKHPRAPVARGIRVLAFDPDRPVFAGLGVEGMREALRRLDTAAFDGRSKRHYGNPRVGETAELARHAVRVVGVFELGTDFVNDGTVLMSEDNFARFFPHRRSVAGELESVEIGVVRLVAGADVAAVQRSLRAALPADVLVLTRTELVDREIAFWRESAPIGYIFGLGAAMGFAIGIMICYQILFTEVTDHLAQFAVLKAIGYTNGYLRWVVVQEALLLSALGFLPGALAGSVLYGWLAAATGLPMRLTAARAGGVLALTLVMTIGSGLFAVRRATATDPAEVFP